ncbi:HAD family hydrolase [Vibrio mexicanus]|uniref:HAD family hydrolase n=1 Tax=Vibrio mexicanus TaxID=1004326 RepID=UPI00063CC7D6|nr:HAD family hydrolase [Vibrio mexicanus]
MKPIILFDWGDTLMVDFSTQPELGIEGKMCDWKVVEAVEGAQEALSQLSAIYDIYIATSAAESSPKEIEQAFARVGLDHYIKGYFCQQNLGLAKRSVEFYQRICQELRIEPEQAIMVGDTLEKDIFPAKKAGLSAIWFNPSKQPAVGGEPENPDYESVETIKPQFSHMAELNQLLS